MADQRQGGISWTSETWNPIRGCSRVSEGCRNCYAERVAATRLAAPGGPYDGLATMTAAGPRWTGQVRLIEDKLDDPLRWGRPRLIFVNSMSDLFHEGLTDEQIDKIVLVMALANLHTYQVLTKRPERMAEYLSDRGLPQRLADLYASGFPATSTRSGSEGNTIDWSNPEAQPTLKRWPLPNVWWGTSAEDQKTAEARIPFLLQCKEHAAVVWLSLEPLLGPVDLRNLNTADELHLDALTGLETMSEVPAYGPKLDWVVVGGESGPDARPMAPRWVRSIRNQCQEHGVRFHFKQWGEWLPVDQRQTDGNVPGIPAEANRQHLFRTVGIGAGVVKVGKKAAGRLLDGKLHDDMPAGPAGKGVN